LPKILRHEPPAWAGSATHKNSGELGFMSETSVLEAASPERGFTLIELMIAVVIAAILMAVAYPNYRDYALRARIGEATTNLQDMRSKAERWFQDKRTYVGMPCAATSPTAHFAFTCTPTPTLNTYTIVATGQSTMSSFAFTINHVNARVTTSVPSGWSGTGATCWVRNKGGAC
jgi:type IV pilus assembly protein PilE